MGVIDAADGGEDPRRGTLRGRPFDLARTAVLSVLKVTIRLRVEGLEHVPMSGPLLVVANHLHNADPVLLEAACPRPIHFMAKKELFRVPVINRIIRLAGTFPVDRGKADRSAIRQAEIRLAHGIAVGVFPEGTRSVSRTLQPAHPGVGLLALRSGAPVIPVAITGSERLPGNGTKARRRGHAAPEPAQRGVRIRFGKPLTVAREGDGQRVRPEAAADLIMVEIARLLPPAYRGVYAGRIEEEQPATAGLPGGQNLPSTTAAASAGE